MWGVPHAPPGEMISPSPDMPPLSWGYFLWSPAGAALSDAARKRDVLPLASVATERVKVRVGGKKPQ